MGFPLGVLTISICKVNKTVAKEEKKRNTQLQTKFNF